MTGTQKHLLVVMVSKDAPKVRAVTRHGLGAFIGHKEYKILFYHELSRSKCLSYPYLLGRPVAFFSDECVKRV